MMQLLLDWGASIDAQDSDGIVALQWASQTGNVEAVEVRLTYTLSCTILIITNKSMLTTEAQ